MISFWNLFQQEMKNCSRLYAQKKKESKKQLQQSLSKSIAFTVLLFFYLHSSFVKKNYPNFIRIYPAGNYMFKVNSRNIRTRCEICSKLTIKTPERRQWQLNFNFNWSTALTNILVILFYYTEYNLPQPKIWLIFNVTSANLPSQYGQYVEFKASRHFMHV